MLDHLYIGRNFYEIGLYHYMKFHGIDSIHDFKDYPEDKKDRLLRGLRTLKHVGFIRADDKFEEIILLEEIRG